MIIKMQNAKEEVEITELEEKILNEMLLRHRKRKSWEELLYLDQIEILFWAVGFAKDSNREIPNLRNLLKSDILERIKNDLLNSLSDNDLEDRIIRLEDYTYTMLKESFPTEIFGLQRKNSYEIYKMHQERIDNEL